MGGGAVGSYDSVRLAGKMEGMVAQNSLRKYYRAVRGGRWYGGIATADCCGCCLRCVFCWSGAPRDRPESVGRFYSPEYVFSKLDRCAEKFGYSQVRVSGNEPTIGRTHLLSLLELFDQREYLFILETNGILIGHDVGYARQLSGFKRIHVRVSVKGTNPGEFSRLTGAGPKGFDLQLRALSNLLDAGVSCHPAVMLSFSSRQGFEEFLTKLQGIDHALVDEVEEEYVFLYPHVVDRLRDAEIKPLIAYSPSNIPRELI